jgi:hypothetical protein
MKNMKIIGYIVIFVMTVPILYASPAEDKTPDEILNEVRISRIPKIIEILEEKGMQALELEKFSEAKEFFQKALILRQAIGMKHTEGSAHILTKISSIESRLGNQCEASKLSKLAKRIYRQIGVNIGAVRIEEAPPKAERVACAETIGWLRD